MENVAAYIDANNLYYGLKEKNYRKYYWLDVMKLIQGQLTNNQELSYVYYFTSAAPDKETRKRQLVYVDALRTVATINQINFIVSWGRFVSDKIPCNSCDGFAVCNRCDQEIFYHHEKETDVNISVQMISDAYEEKYTTAYLITEDSDQVGTIRIIKRLFFSTVKIGILYPPGRNSNQLNKYADFYRHIGSNELGKNQLPETVIASNNYPLSRPAEWN